jgi:hypothetical protein
MAVTIVDMPVRHIRFMHIDAHARIYACIQHLLIPIIYLPLLGLQQVGAVRLRSSIQTECNKLKSMNLIVFG